MAKVKVVVEEVLRRVIEFDDKTEEEALEIVSSNYRKGDIILDNDDFIGHETIEILKGENDDKSE